MSQKLSHDYKFIEHRGIDTLCWDGRDLVDATTGRRFRLEGTISDREFISGYTFDRTQCLRDDNTLWTLVYENRGTKAVLRKNGKDHRELNRSYYFAKAYDYPIALAFLNSGRAVVFHCPNSFDTIVVDDAETGELLGSKKSEGMEFHSRLSISEDSKHLLSAGWFWHPLGGAWLCPVDEIIANVPDSSRETEFTFGAEIDAATFLDNDHLVVSSSRESINDDPGPSGLKPLQLGVWSIPESKWTSIAQLEQPTGTIMPWKDWVISFYGHPKAIELATGKVVHIWHQIDSGHQIGSIELGTPPPPATALNPAEGMFAVCNANGIHIVPLSCID